MLNRNNRGGFTLIELMITMVIMLIVGAAVGKVLVNSLRVGRGQMVQADMQSNVRTVGLVLPMELREIGFDSNLTTSLVTSDIEVMARKEIQVRAMRGTGMTCGVPTLAAISIQKPTFGNRRPLLTDGFLLFVENDPNTGGDDQWIPLTVTAVNNTALCGADSAITLTFAIPQVSPGVNLTLSQIFVGGPIRYYERMRFGLYVEADGKSYLGARSVSLGEANYRAVAGPLHPGEGLILDYFNRAGVKLDPATADPADVRVVDLSIWGQTGDAISLSGSSQRGTGNMTVKTSIALRNTLSH
jgi:prepilin-type N-terminal cleavage/methylation domain-containing protein